jgi:WD40 repeat protein
MLHTLHIKTHQFFCVDFSNDGSVLVSAGSLDLPGRKYNYAFEIQVWGLQPGNTPALLRTLTGHNHSILTVKVSPDSQKLVSTSCDKTVRTWCVGSGMQLAVFREHQSDVKCAAWSPSSKVVATAETNLVVRVWDAATGTQFMEMVGPDAWPSSPKFRKVCLAFVSETTVRVCMSSSQQIGTYDLREGGRSACRMLDGHRCTVTSVAISPDNKYIVSGGWDCCVYVWDAETGNLIHSFEGHCMAANCLAWSPDGKFIVSGSADWTARVWGFDDHVCVLSSGMAHFALNVPENQLCLCSCVCDGVLCVAGSNTALHAWTCGLQVCVCALYVRV